MSLRFVLGPSGSGKSIGIYEHMISEAIKHPKRQYLIIVPDQYTMQIQKQIVSMHPGNAILNIDILSFGRLYHRVMEELGGDSLTPLDDTGKNLILRRLAEEMKEEIPVLGKLMEHHGYISEVKGIISEFQQYGISPEEMEHVIQESASRRGLQARLEDIQKLYKAYVAYQKDSYRTSESMYPILTKRLKESSIWKDTVLCLDGFTGFTPVQMPLVQELMILSKEMYVTMTIEGEPKLVTTEQQLFYITAKTIQDLEKLAERARVRVESYIWYTGQKRFEGQPELAHFEQNLFREKTSAYTKETNAITIWQAANPQQESLWLAGEIKRLIREEGYQYRDIAVICGSMDTYRHPLQEAMLQMEIPYFMDTNTKIMHNPATELLMGLLEILERDFSYAGVMRYVRSGFSTLTAEEADLFEVYLIETGIRGRKAFLRPFTRKGKTFSLEHINQLREKLIKEIEPCLFEGNYTVRTYMEQLYHFMEQLCVEQKLWEYAEAFEQQGDMARAKEYHQIYREIMDLFNQMTVLMGDEEMSLEHFQEILQAGFEELQVGLIPAKADQVLIGDMERTRLSQVKALFVVGVNDTNIPGNNTKGGMISDMDREYLTNQGITLAPTRRQLQFRQRFYLYQQLTKPSQRLYLSYALLDNAEKEIRPSYFIGTVKKLFPRLIVQKISLQNMPEHRSMLIQQTAQLLREYAEGSLPSEQHDILYTMLFVLQQHKEQDIVNQMLEQAFLMGGSEKIDPSIARALYGSVLYGSISRLEQFAACPYAHFLKYGMGLRKPEEYVLHAADLGNIFHDVLASFGKDLEKDGYSWKNFPNEYGEEKISEKLALLKEQYGDELLLDKARNGYALTRAERILKRSLGVLKTHMQAGAFQTYGVEIDFDISCEWNATRELMMRLQGRIDRLDVAKVEDDMYVKVIDYKTGNKQLELDCMYEGLQMQLIVYMDSSARLLEAKYPKNHIHPAAMFYYRVADPIVSMDGAQDLDNLDAALLKEQRSRGLLNADETVVHLLDSEMETTSNIIPYSRKKDGSPTQSSSVCSETDFDVMRKFAHHKIYEMGSQIMNGDIEKKPYVRNIQEDGCMYCDYKGICGFDEKQTGYEKKQIKTMSDEEALEQMKQKLAEKEERWQ